MKTPYWWWLPAALATSLTAATVPNPPANTPIAEPAPAPMATTAPAAPAKTNAPAAQPARKKKVATTRKKRAAKPAAAKSASTNAPAAASKSAKLAPGPAVVTGREVNVRGRASLGGEVITRLNPGDAVTVFEPVTLAKPKPGEPAEWARIAFPTNATAWVFANYVDPTNKTVTATKLNLRIGPGENYSVVGTLNRGDSVTEILAKDNWLQIEPPTNAFAFIAAEFLKQAAPEPPALAPATNVVSAPVVVPPPVAPPPAETTNVAATTTNVPAPLAVSTEASNVVAAATSTNPPPVAATTTNEPPAPPPTPVAEEPPPKRIVQREGIVRTAWSIQAPSGVELANPDTGETMDYLYSPSPRLDLRRYKGLRVLVSGEEGLDKRWKNTPVLTIRKIQLAD